MCRKGSTKLWVCGFIRMDEARLSYQKPNQTRRLPSTTEILRGSLLRRRIRHRSGCTACARGKGHLVWVLTVSYPGGRNKPNQPLSRTEARRPAVVAQLPETQD